MTKAMTLRWQPKMCEACDVEPATWANDDFRELVPIEQWAMTHCDECLESRDYDLPVSCEPDIIEALWRLRT